MRERQSRREELDLDHAFWHDRWQSQQIGFHEDDGSSFLKQWFHVLNLSEGDRVFVPLCGKSRDIAWLLSQGMGVVGCELSEIAVKELFEELDVEPTVRAVGEFIHYAGPDVDVFVGDVFALSASVLGAVSAVYDRAALIALPEPMRARYAEHLKQLAPKAPHLIVSIEYDQRLMSGPPFSVDGTAIGRLYGEAYELTQLDWVETPHNLKGVCPAGERVWLMG